MSKHRMIKSSMIFLVGMTICLICLIFDKEVVQASNKLELSGYIGESLSETITQFENMSEPSWSMGITSSFNKQVCFAGAGDAADKDVITRIIITGEDNPYSLYGVSTDMSEEEIWNVLMIQGFGRMYCNNTYFREELFIHIEQRQNAGPAISLAEISWGKHRDKEEVFSYIGGTMQQALEELEGLSMRVVGEQVVAGTEGLEFRGNLYSKDPILTQITRITISGFNNGYSIYGVIPGDAWNSGSALNFPSGGSGEFLDPADNILDIYGINSSENPSIELSMIKTDLNSAETETLAEHQETPVTEMLEPEVSDIEINDVITLGHYEQNNNLADGMEEIEWIVLDKNGKNILLISKYGLDVQKYHYVWANVTWENCFLRDWLNNTFLKTAFNDKEQTCIVSVLHSNPDNPEFGTQGGNDTEDKVFLLSYEEAQTYFQSDAERVVEVTEYAKSKEAYLEGGNYAYWWLRSPGTSECNDAMLVTKNGRVDLDGSCVDREGRVVRPVMWVAYD